MCVHVHTHIHTAENKIVKKNALDDIKLVKSGARNRDDRVQEGSE